MPELAARRPRFAGPPPLELRGANLVDLLSPAYGTRFNLVHEGYMMEDREAAE